MFESCSILFGQLVVASLPGLSTLLSGATGRTLVSSSSTASKGAELASRKNLPRLISLARKFLVKPNSCYSCPCEHLCVVFSIFLLLSGPHFVSRFYVPSGSVSLETASHC